MDVMKKTIVYIDGYNLYYGLLKGTSYKWLDLFAFARRLLGRCGDRFLHRPEAWR